MVGGIPPVSALLHPHPHTATEELLLEHAVETTDEDDDRSARRPGDHLDGRDRVGGQSPHTSRRPDTWWWFGGIMVFLWITLLLVPGFTTLANGHKAMFWIWIIFPVRWIIGSFMAPTEEAIARGA